MKFTDSLCIEVKRCRNLIEESERELKAAPKGHLAVRARKKGNSYYWEIDEVRGGARKNTQIGINDNPELILRLTEKKRLTLIRNRCRQNLKYLEKIQKKYQSVDEENIYKLMGSKYREVLRCRSEKLLQQRVKETYSKARFDPAVHVHETDCGIRTRSKSEQIIANTLHAFGIPFHYEEEFFHSTGIKRRIFPDFTILLPNGEKLIWEHLGLLSDLRYCEDTALKLHIFQRSGLVLGKNLILTMDDDRGDCSSEVIVRIIRECILPHFQTQDLLPLI
ncbi:MAG: hypothetical protein ACI4LA_02330 [Emergencia sp.]